MDNTAIGEIIETYINPTLLEHQGWIELEDWENGLLTIRFRGACAGCGGTRKTLEEFVIPTLKGHVREITEVRLAEGVSQDLYEFVLNQFTNRYI